MSELAPINSSYSRDFVVAIFFFDAFEETLGLSPLALHLVVLLQEREQDLVIVFEIATASCKVLLSRHHDEIVDAALENTGVTQAEAAFEA